MKVVRYVVTLAIAGGVGVTAKASAQEARVAEAEARKTALAAVPGGKVRSHELERENGKLIYSYDIKVAGKPGVEEVNVDAITGAIVAREHESAKVEAKEKKTKP